MKVLLVKPYNLSDHIQPSLGLGYLATAIRDTHTVMICDLIKDRVRPHDFWQLLDREKPDVVGFQCYTFDVYNIAPMLSACKKRSIITILGGPHPSAAPRETMSLFGDTLDYLFVGEAEIGLRMLLDHLAGIRYSAHERIPGLVWHNKNNLAINPPVIVDDIDRFGIPAWDLIKPNEYPECQHGAFFRQFPIAPIITTRGCPFVCTFCAGNLISGRKLRKRSATAILTEMRLLYDTYGIREFHIVDDNLTLDNAFAKQFLRHLAALHLPISWAVPNGIRMDTLDDELLTLMKQTGLYLISLGIESGSDRMLTLMKKAISRDIIIRSIARIRAHRIPVAGFFILGYPGETRAEMEETISFSLSLDLMRANYFTYLPFPGTESYAELMRKGKLAHLDMKHFYFMNATYAPDGIDRKTLKRLQQSAFLRFYLRPGILMHNIAAIKSWRHFLFLMKRFTRWMFFW